MVRVRVRVRIRVRVRVRVRVKVWVRVRVRVGFYPARKRAPHSSCNRMALTPNAAESMVQRRAPCVRSMPVVF
jgi:hypothetical protein